MIYAVYNKPRRQIAYATGGHPPAVLVAGNDSEGAAPSLLGTGGMIIGGLPGMTFQQAVCDMPASSRLYFFSDGVYEITKPDGSMMKLPEFVEILSGANRLPGASAIDQTVAAIRTVRGSDHFEDDVSIVEVTF